MEVAVFPTEKGLFKVTCREEKGSRRAASTGPKRPARLRAFDEEQMQWTRLKWWETPFVGYSTPDTDAVFETAKDYVTNRYGATIEAVERTR